MLLKLGGNRQLRTAVMNYCNRAHRERASRELLAIFERFKLTQM